ncbi:hypothetical protein LCGC14_2595590 [marine sediment metagenome]|uniref:Uncharacterized protein n=1 Tax=marine sediment metagenome TaxID=412755 RepID=A0A0F9CLB0_9ZZZZ
MANLPPLLAIQRAVVLESAANTLTEQQIQTPVSATARMIMRVWRIVFGITVGALPSTFPAADAKEIVSSSIVLSTRQGETTLPAIEQGGTLAAASHIFIQGSAPADAGIAMTQNFINLVWEYPGGIGLADSTLSMYIQSVGMAGASGAQILIYYTMEVVSTDEFLAIASILSDVR